MQVWIKVLSLLRRVMLRGSTVFCVHFFNERFLLADFYGNKSRKLQKAQGSLSTALPNLTLNIHHPRGNDVFFSISEVHLFEEKDLLLWSVQMCICFYQEKEM